MINYDLDFHGYYRECNKSSLPAKAGIYCVYTCKYNTTLRKLEQLNLIYIGESENIYDRHKDNKHEHYKDFCKALSVGEQKFIECIYSINCFQNLIFALQ